MADGPNPCSTSRRGILYDMQRTPGADSDTYYKESWTPALVNSSFVAKVDWEDANEFVVDMLGEHQQSGVKIRRHNPEQHPFNPNLYCVGCEIIRNLGELTRDISAGNSVKYEWVEYACTFAAFLYDIKDDDDVDGDANGELIRYIERRAKQAGQSIQANGLFEFATGRAAAWNIVSVYAIGDMVSTETDADGVRNWKSLTNANVGNTPVEGVNWTTVGATGTNYDPIPTPPAIMVPYREIQYVWHYVPGPINRLLDVSDAYYGTVNDRLFDSLVIGGVEYGYAAGTLLYLGMDYEPVPSTPAGNRIFKVTHKFAFRKQGWNTAYRPNSASINTAGDWDAVRSRRGRRPPYASSNMLKLFQV